MDQKILICKMKENYRYFGGLSVIYGLIFAFCLYKNMYGITFPICIAVTIIFAVLMMRKINYRLMKRSFPYILGMILLGISTALTTSFLIHFFNMVGIILLFAVFMIHQFYKDCAWNFPAYLKRICILFGTTLTSIVYPYSHGVEYLTGSKSEKKRTLLAVITGFFMALGTLSIVLPLLLRSDAVFSNIFGDLLKYINFSTIFGIVFAVILGFTLCYAFFAALCKYNFPAEEGRKLKYYNAIIGITFTSVISIIYLFYSLVQVVYLFIGIRTGLPEAVTYSEYARSGFWELLFVSFINFIIVLLCMYLFTNNIVLKMILTIISGCTFIMIFSAAYRMIMYIDVYHLTFLRILVIWFLLVLTLIMSGVIVSIYKRNFPLFHYTMAIVSVLYIGLSYSRPDTITVKYNILHSDSVKAEDIYYYIYNVSMDVAPEIAKIDMDEIEGGDEHLKGEVYNYFYNISVENEDIYFRKANYSRIRAKLAADKYVEKHRGEDVVVYLK